MDKFVVHGGVPLKGEVRLSGAKNVALKTIVASLLTDDEITIDNVPDIIDVRLMLELLGTLGVKSHFSGNHVRLIRNSLRNYEVPLEVGARLRTTTLVLGPLLSRFGSALVPNPGGCRIGARPIDRHIDALRQMGARITYNSRDGFFHGQADSLHGTVIRFPKNTHTGTESIILAAVLAKGQTVIENAAAEVEVDDLIEFLNGMGARIVRTKPREIKIDGVTRLHGTSYRLMSDRNEEVTLAVAAALTGGTVTVTGSVHRTLMAFLNPFRDAGGRYSAGGDTATYSVSRNLRPQDIITAPHPGFMTDWQGPWAVLMTRAAGLSTIHEAVFESRFSYVPELQKMGADVSFFQPEVRDPEKFYNFNMRDHDGMSPQAVRIKGPTRLHDAVLMMHDLRAGATLLLAALTAPGKSYVHGIEHIDRGYENIEKKLQALGGRIIRVPEEAI
ncbi:UDP-N-acetylglucosamine 1-carboxyvinyltransferase [Candidatus Gottesmanbacteria bacterium RBG_16_52_11]|uniref:UDP-N-acetylglucosamine 1-carboxyvinyltransferase n=1 Tax=Candidatus Gottesmanbacteria bacterium RBG_16_52_11 TaxID=1798374 RepID=A0A1F5YUZ0_9BACT|nr:MAG: UDP-N-acetylglucosamine 1-carboxyvinyltransferase [Candidatus Gottesmanbacteria bacterium RBG_16_52_11]